MSESAATGVRDFDFLVGSWTVANRRLAQRLAGSSEWQEFRASAACRLILDGHANIDEIRAPEHGLVGMTLRLYATARSEWWLYWASGGDGILQPPVVGRFTGGRGEFYGDDTFDDVPIRVRYIWSRITPTSARWEQAFSTDGERTWETNWIMDFTRVDST